MYSTLVYTVQYMHMKTQKELHYNRKYGFYGNT